MKRVLAAALAAVMLCGCSAGVSAPSDGGEKKLSVVAAIFPAYDFARQVFGDSAEVTLLLKPGMESHSYDPSARDIVKIEGCDLFIYNGGESDRWVSSILDAAENTAVFRMADCVEGLAEEYSEGMQHEEEEHDEDMLSIDEHIWTSPKNAAKIVEALGDTAAELFPESGEDFRANAAGYSAGIMELDRRFGELLSGETRSFVFGDRFPLLYFFKEYGLSYYAAFPGCGSETEPSAQTVTFLLDKLSEPDTVKTVFCIELSNRAVADALAESSGLPTAEFHSCHNISADDFAAGESYLSLMERNLAVLETALGEQ